MKDRQTRIFKLSRQLSESNNSEFTLLIIAVADASLLPLPVTTIYILLALMNPEKSYKYASIPILGTLFGAIAGYITGHFALIGHEAELTGFAQGFLKIIPGISEIQYQKMQLLYSEWGLWMVIGSGFSPIPYCFVSISSGAFDLNIFTFGLVTTFTQSIKYIFLGFLTNKLGPRILSPLRIKSKPAAVVLRNPGDPGK